MNFLSKNGIPSFRWNTSLQSENEVHILILVRLKTHQTEDPKHFAIVPLITFDVSPAMLLQNETSVVIKVTNYYLHGTFKIGWHRGGELVQGNAHWSHSRVNTSNVHHRNVTNIIL